MTETELIARYHETDQMGIIHHSVYVTWCEVARTDWIKQTMEMSYGELEQAGLMLPVIGVTVDYQTPAKYEDRVLIETKLAEYNGVRVSFEYTIKQAETGRVAVKAITRHCWTNGALRPINLAKKHPDFHQKLSQLINEG